MAIFKLKKKPLRLLGRGGIAYCKHDIEYYISSENILAKEAEINVAIYYKGIKILDSDKALTDKEKKALALEVKELLEKKGRCKVGIFPI